MICGSCGANVPEGIDVCPACGARMGGSYRRGAHAPSGRKERHRVSAGAVMSVLTVFSAAVIVVGLIFMSFRGEHLDIVNMGRDVRFDLPALPSFQEPATEQSAQDESAQEEAPSVEVRDTTADYSWEELSAISDMIASAASDEEGLEIAEEYHLANSDGTLDGTQTTSFELEDGTQVEATIVGFRHDERTDGGVAGITFLTTGAVADQQMNSWSTESGGWRASDLRSWMGSSLMEELPDDLADVVVSVEKQTNNEGVTDDVSNVTATSDYLWAPSVVELASAPDEAEFRSDYQYVVELFAAEGSQYQYFSDAGVTWGEASDALVVNYLPEPALYSSFVQGEACAWWTRTPLPYSGYTFVSVSADGDVTGDTATSEQMGVVVGFCV